MKRLLILLLSATLLVACAPTSTQRTPTLEAFVTATLPSSASVSGATSSEVPVVATPTDDPSILGELFPNANIDKELTRIDEQGMVVVEVTPLNLEKFGDTLDFDVVLNTHSVDLSMDLAQLSSLTTDNGVVVQALVWDAPLGGHHVAGKLIFPATKDGVSVLNGATSFSLQIRNVDVDLRTFEWQLK